MSDNPETDDQMRRKRLRFRAWHRGIKETDLILGPFADAYVEAFTEFGAPSDAKSEKDLETSSVEMAAGTISGIRGHLDLISKRTRKPMNDGAAMVIGRQ